MENPDLRMSTGMRPDQKGVRIRRIDPTAPESKVLKPSDVILSFDGIDIANDGTGECSFLSFFMHHVQYVVYICLLKTKKILSGAVISYLMATLIEEGSYIKHMTSFRTRATLVELNMSHSAPQHATKFLSFT